MTNDDALSLLRAGLDEDERIARAAAALWRADVVEGVDVEGTVGSAAYDHILAHGPARTLDRVEAIRKAIAEVRDPKTFDAYDSADIDHTSFREGVEAAADFFVAALASIYAEPTDETEKP